MGESKKRPIHAYVDETGNTGANIFDEAQPDYFTAALVLRGDFDAVHGKALRAIAAKIGAEGIHANELGVGRIEQIAPDLIRLLIDANAHFFLSRVEKQYLLATKLFDSLFDSGENAAVPWHCYNVRFLRLALTYKVSRMIDVETARLFWDCLCEPRPQRVQAMIPEICTGLLQHIDRVVDARSREIITEALEWARDHPEAIQMHVSSKSTRQGHFPNVVAFGNLLEGLDGYSKRWKKRVARITHDRQNQFEKTLAVWHEMFSNASDEPLDWAGETWVFQKVVGSTFEVKADDDSPGIQIADTILWLYKQVRNGRDLPRGCSALIAFAISRAWHNDFSFEGVERQFVANNRELMFGEMTPEQIEESRGMISTLEQHRRDSLAQYARDGIVPFMRSNPPMRDVTPTE
ncbi:DUF3800 domain-containing protein [Aureimonas sp. N4]|uniref:DUF3800 domain-containing protein n=1 Tax=Aureimonas sp. N4 TaxID=1638165 RepID=UPI0007826332|nr:DUF3800 domain-containing protein [Aureimonas sp. N4]